MPYENEVKTKITVELLLGVLTDWYSLRRHIFPDADYGVAEIDGRFIVRLGFGMDEFKYYVHPIGLEYLEETMVKEILTAMLQKNIFEYIRKGIDL